MIFIKIQISFLLYTNLCVNIYNIISPNSQNSLEHTAKLNFVEYKG